MELKTTVKLINKQDSNVKGVASVVFDNCFVVKGIKIIEGNKGLFIAMPSIKVGNEYKQDCYPITAEFREILSGSVLEAYNEQLTQSQSQGPVMG